MGVLVESSKNNFRTMSDDVYCFPVTLYTARRHIHRQQDLKEVFAKGGAEEIAKVDRISGLGFGGCVRVSTLFHSH